MADSIVVACFIAEISEEEYSRCLFPARDRNDQNSASADFRSAYPFSPITRAQFKITPFGKPMPDKPDERYRHGRIDGYRVEINAPACLNGHNRFLVNGVAKAARIAVRLLHLWLTQNGCTEGGLDHMKDANVEICSVTLTFLYENHTEDEARTALAAFRAHSEVVMNPSNPKPGNKPRAYSYPPSPLPDKNPYTYTSYIRMREFQIAVYVKERNQPNAFLLPIQDEEIENEIQHCSEGTLRVEITLHSKWLKDNELDSIKAWEGNPQAYEQAFALIRSTLRLDEGLRTRRLKRSTIASLKLSSREKDYLSKHINGMHIQDKHPDSEVMDSRKWTRTYSAARINILKATNGIDLDIRYADQMHNLKPVLVGMLRFNGEYKPPAEWAQHVFSRKSVPRLMDILDRCDQLTRSGSKNFPEEPLRDRGGDNWS